MDPVDDDIPRAAGLSAARFDQVGRRIDAQLGTMDWRGGRARRLRATIEGLTARMGRHADALDDAARLVSRLDHEIELAREEKRREELARALARGAGA
jgi:hypothetical protein